MKELMPPRAIPYKSLDDALRERLRHMLREELLPLLKEELSPFVRGVEAAVREEVRAPQRGSQPARAGLLSVKEVAALCGVTTPTVRSWIKSGLLLAINPGAGRVYRVRQEDLAAFLQRRPGQATDAPGVDEQVELILGRVRGAREKD